MSEIILVWCSLFFYQKKWQILTSDVCGSCIDGIVGQFLDCRCQIKHCLACDNALSWSFFNRPNGSNVGAHNLVSFNNFWLWWERTQNSVHLWQQTTCGPEIYQSARTESRRTLPLEIPSREACESYQECVASLRLQLCFRERKRKVVGLREKGRNLFRGQCYTQTSEGLFDRLPPKTFTWQSDDVEERAHSPIEPYIITQK